MESSTERELALARGSSERAGVIFDIDGVLPTRRTPALPRWATGRVSSTPAAMTRSSKRLNDCSNYGLIAEGRALDRRPAGQPHGCWLEPTDFAGPLICESTATTQALTIQARALRELVNEGFDFVCLDDDPKNHAMYVSEVCPASTSSATTSDSFSGS